MDQVLVLEPSPWEAEAEQQPPGFIDYDELLHPQDVVPQNIKNHTKRTKKKRPQTSSGTRRSRYDPNLLMNGNKNVNSGRRNRGTSSSRHFEFNPGHSRAVGGHERDIIRPMRSTLQSKRELQLQQIEVMRSQTGVGGYQQYNPTGPQGSLQNNSSSSFSSLHQGSSLHLSPVFSRKRRQHSAPRQRTNKSPSSNKRRSRPQSAFPSSSSSSTSTSTPTSTSTTNKPKNNRPQTAGSGNRTRNNSASMPSLLNKRTVGSSLFDRNNNQAESKLRDLRIHLRSIVQVHQHQQKYERTSHLEPSVPQTPERPTSSQLVRSSLSSPPQSLSKFAPGLKQTTNAFIEWLSTDWLKDRARLQTEAATRRNARMDAARGLHDDLNGLGIRDENDEELPHYMDEISSEYSDDDERYSSTVDNFTAWVSDAWPGVQERRKQNGMKDSRTYPSEELMMMSKICQTYGKEVGSRLASGFQFDLQREILEKKRKGSSGTLPYCHRVRLLDRWFDLALQQLIHEEPRIKQNENNKRDQEIEIGKDDDDDNTDDESSPAVGPIEESSKRLWSSGLVPLHVIAASEAVALVQENEIGADNSKYAPLANLVQRLFLGLLQSTNDVLSMEVARRVRAEALAKDIGKQLSKMKSAKSGWAKAKRAGGRLKIMRMLKRTMDQEFIQQVEKRKSAAMEMTDEERMKLLSKNSNFLSDEDRMRIALSVLRDPTMLNELLLKMSTDDYHHLLDVHNENNKNSNTGGDENGGNGESGRKRMISEMEKKMPDLLELNPNLLNNASNDAKHAAISALLAGAGAASTLTQLLSKQLSEYTEGRPKAGSTAAVSYGSGDLEKVHNDAKQAAQLVVSQMQSSLSKVPHSSDWKIEFRKVVGGMMRDFANPGCGDNSSSNGGNNGGNRGSSGANGSTNTHSHNGGGNGGIGGSSVLAIGNAVDDFAHVLEGSLQGLLGAGSTNEEDEERARRKEKHGQDAHDRVVGSNGKNNDTNAFQRGAGIAATDDAQTREALATFGRNLAGRLSTMDKRLLDSILLSTVASRRAHEISDEWHQGIHHADTPPWWDEMKAQSAKHALEVRNNERREIETQTTKIDFKRSGGASSTNAGNYSGDTGTQRRKEERHGTVMIKEEDLVTKILGLSHFLTKNYIQVQAGSKKKKQRKLPKITTTMKSFLAMIGEMVQAKYAADCTDHFTGQRPQPFPDFLQQFFQLKFGKQHARAYQQSMKRLVKLAAEVEHYYDKAPRVRMFARAAGILVCCQGGVCGCKCPDLLEVHIAARNERKGTFVDEDGDGIDDREIESFIQEPPKSKTNLSTGRGITRFRREMAEFWVDLVASAFSLPSTKKVAKRARADSQGDNKDKKNKPPQLVKQQDPDKLAQALGDGSKVCLYFCVHFTRCQLLL